MNHDDARSIIVLDFETTGLSPNAGDRSIEVGAVKIRDGEVVDRFQSLMNPGFRISGFIEEYTGITNEMLARAPCCGKVMRDFHAFVGGMPLVAHNAGFDRRFLEAEWSRIDVACGNEFGCSLLTARRVYPDAPNHRLETLVGWARIKAADVFHRALADAEMTGRLWLRMVEELERRHDLDPLPFSVMQRLGKVPKRSVDTFLTRLKSKSA